MPSNVTRICSSLLLFTAALVSSSFAQTVAQSSPNPATPAPTSGDVMRDRIAKAKAYIVVRNYNAAIYELENIRKESGDPAVRGVVNNLLMNSYLEQGDYKRAQDFLTQFYNEQKTTKAGAADAYAVVAGQVIKGARMRAERYKALGLNIGDRTLPLEALNDLEKMRETVEMVITQAKEIGKTPARTADAMAILEEATNSRTMIARDDYDAKRWKDEVADTREEITNSRSVVRNAVADGLPDAPNAQPTANVSTVAANTTASPVIIIPSASATANTANNSAPPREREVKPVPENTTAANTSQPVFVPTQPTAALVNLPAPKKEEPKPVETPKAETTASASPALDANGNVDVGGTLVSYATNKQSPVYPAVARAMRASGVVKVEVTVDEKGNVAQVHKATGPMTLQSAASDAIKKWKFKPFMRDGQAVKASGYVNFNFAL